MPKFGRGARGGRGSTQVRKANMSQVDSNDSDSFGNDDCTNYAFEAKKKSSTIHENLSIKQKRKQGFFEHV
jgi:hypothetical protein